MEIIEDVKSFCMKYCENSQKTIEKCELYLKMTQNLPEVKNFNVINYKS